MKNLINLTPELLYDIEKQLAAKNWYIDSVESILRFMVDVIHVKRRNGEAAKLMIGMLTNIQREIDKLPMPKLSLQPF